MNDLCCRFEQLSTLLQGLLEEIILGAFINELQDEIWAEVKMFQSQNLKEVIKCAQTVEEKNCVIGQSLDPN